MYNLEDSYITEERISLQYPARDKRDAIQMAGKLLLQDGIIEENYIDAMIQTCEMFESYIVLVPGIAIPHASPEKGAKENGFAILQLRDPIEFGNMDNDPVRLVIAIAAKDTNSHLAMLETISKLILNAQNVRRLMLAEKKEEVLEIIKKMR